MSVAETLVSIIAGENRRTHCSSAPSISCRLIAQGLPDHARVAETSSDAQHLKGREVQTTALIQSRPRAGRTRQAAPRINARGEPLTLQ